MALFARAAASAHTGHFFYKADVLPGEVQTVAAGQLAGDAQHHASAVAREHLVDTWRPGEHVQPGEELQRATFPQHGRRSPATIPNNSVRCRGRAERHTAERQERFRRMNSVTVRQAISFRGAPRNRDDDEGADGILILLEEERFIKFTAHFVLLFLIQFGHRCHF